MNSIISLSLSLSPASHTYVVHTLIALLEFLNTAQQRIRNICIHVNLLSNLALASAYKDYMGSEVRGQDQEPATLSLPEAI